MSDFWNERYSANEYVYGKEPQILFKEFIDFEPPSCILLPAEGEGRNAIYAAKKGWQVHAFDSSSEAKKKALNLASENQVQIDYTITRVEDFKVVTETYDYIALVYLHLPEEIRIPFHQKLVDSLKKGGKLFLVAFSPKQLSNQTGGPKDIRLLYDLEKIKKDFKGLDFLSCKEVSLNLNEGDFHKGQSENILIIGQKN